jgi:hypothetical protein
VGGVLGGNYFGSTIACYNTGPVSGSDGGSVPSSYLGVGGVVGFFVSDGNDGEIIACYNTGAITILSGIEGYFGGVAGYIEGTGSPITAIKANYWKTVPVVRGIGYDNYIGYGSEAAKEFSGSDWPSTVENGEWGTGSGLSGQYWKTLGGWNGGTPIYPKLWYEE